MQRYTQSSFGYLRIFSIQYLKLANKCFVIKTFNSKIVKIYFKTSLTILPQKSICTYYSQWTDR